MNSAPWDPSLERFSPRVLARIFGGIGLFGIAAGFFDIGYVHSLIMVDGNTVATMHNLLAYQTMFRAGIALHLLMVLLNVVAAVAAFFIFRRVNPLIATLALCCAVAGASTESLDMLGSILPLQLVGAPALGGLSAAQGDALSYLSLHLQHIGLLISFLFWGLDELLMGYLIFRSGFLPRVLGVLLALSGCVYLIDPLVSFGAPEAAALIFPSALVLCLPGEFLSAAWMAAVGLNTARWREWRDSPRTGQAA